MSNPKIQWTLHGYRQYGHKHHGTINNHRPQKWVRFFITLFLGEEITAVQIFSSVNFTYIFNFLSMVVLSSPGTFFLPTLFLFPTTGILCLTQCHRDATSIDTMLELMTCDDRLPYIPNGNVRKLGRHRTILGANVFFIFFFYFRETPLVQNAHIYDTRAFLLLFVFVFVSYIYNFK